MWSSRLLSLYRQAKADDGGESRQSGASSKSCNSWSDGERRTPWVVPQEETYQLVFFKKVYARLLELHGREAEEAHPGCSEGVPLRCLQNAVDRIRVLTDTRGGFDAHSYNLRGDGTAGWWEFCLVWQKERLTVRYSTAERIFLTLEDPQASHLGRLTSIFVLLAILLSAGSFIISTMPSMQEQHCPECEPEPLEVFARVDTVCVVLFICEYLLRLVTSASMRKELANQDELVEAACSAELLQVPSKLRRAWNFVRAWPNVIDLAAILPTCVAWTVSLLEKDTKDETNRSDTSMVLLKLLRLLRVVRAFRLGRRFEAVIIIAKAMQRSIRIIWVLVLNLSLNMLIFGAIIFLFEQGEYDVYQGKHLRPTFRALNPDTGEYELLKEPSPFESIPHAFWWALVTATTVGYGDLYPTTNMGKVTAGVAAVWSLCVLALPVGVIGKHFDDVWKEYDDEKLKERNLVRSSAQMEKQTASAIDPLSLSRRVVFEVFHNSGLYTQANDVFLGEAEIELQLEPERLEPVEKRLRLQLHENRTKSRRRIWGELQIGYTWEPLPPSHPDMELEGKLSITIEGARGLAGLDWHGSGKPDAYVVVTVYPDSPNAENAVLNAKQAQTQTVMDSQAPVWEETFCFTFQWHRNGVQAFRELERQLTLHRWQIHHRGSIATLASVTPEPAEEPAVQGDKAEEAQEMLDSVPQLRRELAMLRLRLPQLQETVQRLRDNANEVLAQVWNGSPTQSSLNMPPFLVQ